MIDVTCTYDDTGCPVLVVSGAVDDADLPTFRTVLEGALEGGHRSVTVDLRGATVDAPGLLRHCTTVAARLERAGRRLEVVGAAAPARVARLEREVEGLVARQSRSPLKAL